MHLYIYIFSNHYLFCLYINVNDFSERFVFYTLTEILINKLYLLSGNEAYLFSCCLMLHFSLKKIYWH